MRNTRNACIAIVALAIAFAAAPAAEAVCILEDQPHWNDQPGGRCSSVNTFPPDPWVCITDYPTNCV